MPRLVRGAGEGNVEADLDDLVLRPEHRLAHGDEPGVGGDVDEAADPLGLDLDVIALRPARQRAAGTAFASSNRADVLAQCGRPSRRGKAPLRPMIPSP